MNYSNFTIDVNIPNAEVESPSESLKTSLGVDSGDYARLTIVVKDVLFNAYKQDYGHRDLWSVTILYALLVNKNDAVLTLMRMGVDVDAVKQKAKESVDVSDSDGTAEIKDVIKHAIEEADAAQFPLVDTNHLLLGLLRCGGSAAHRILSDFDVTYQKVLAHGSNLSPTCFMGSMRSILEQAQNDARDWRHGFIRTEHVLYALLVRDTVSNQRTNATLILRGLGVDLDKLERSLEDLFKVDNSINKGEIPFDGALEDVLNVAFTKSKGKVYTEHFLLGMLRCGCHSFLFNEYGVTYEKVKACIANGIFDDDDDSKVDDSLSKTGMTFMEALVYAEKGKKIRRKSFKDGFYASYGDTIYLSFFDKDGCSTHTFSFADYNANDWEVIYDTMPFIEALEQAKQGKKIAELGERFETVYARFDEKGSLCLYYRDTDKYLETMVLQVIDVDSENWYVVE
jgi:hypothetical protein